MGLRVAALYDVHGNLPALDAVLAEVEAEGVDAIVFGGDTIAGPMPVEVLDRVRALGERAVAIRGNGEREALDPPGGELPVAQMAAFVHERLDAGQRAEVGAWPLRRALDVEGLGPVLFCHASPRRDDELLTVLTPPERWRPMLEGVAEATVVCGHVHRQSDRRLDRWRVVNAGSVGMPYEGRAGAYWALLGPGVELRRTELDVEALARDVRATGYPLADGLVAESFADSVDPDAVQRMFEERFGGR